MDLSKMMVVCAVALSGLAVGCKDSCKSNCEDTQKCANATALEKATNCDNFCSNVDNVSDSASCNSQKDNLLNCEDGANACDTNACAAQLIAWGGCVVTYCNAHSTDSSCVALAPYLPN
jgi:hypothetical protein